MTMVQCNVHVPASGARRRGARTLVGGVVMTAFGKKRDKSPGGEDRKQEEKKRRRAKQQIPTFRRFPSFLVLVERSYVIIGLLAECRV